MYTLFHHILTNNNAQPTAAATTSVEATLMGYRHDQRTYSIPRVHGLITPLLHMCNLLASQRALWKWSLHVRNRFCFDCPSNGTHRAELGINIGFSPSESSLTCVSIEQTCPTPVDRPHHEQTRKIVRFCVQHPFHHQHHHHRRRRRRRRFPQMWIAASFSHDYPRAIKKSLSPPWRGLVASSVCLHACRPLPSPNHPTIIAATPTTSTEFEPTSQQSA